MGGVGLAMLLLGCGKPSAMDVCKKLEAAGVAANCRVDQPNGLGAGAAEKVAFDLPSVPTKGGAVMRFEREEVYTSTESAFTAAAALAGPHRYGSKKALIFVQMNDKAPADVGQKAKAVVDGL